MTTVVPKTGFLNRVVRNRRWWALLFWVNALGSLYGFWWYRHQLADTPARYWPIVPDSPGSTFLFSVFLFLLLRGRVAPAPGGEVVRLRGGAALLGAVAFLSNMKYGLWTAIVLPYHAIGAGRWTFDDVHLSLSHAGMWLQAFLYLGQYRPTRGAAAAAVTWMLFQDVVDYWLLHTHPTLPDEALHDLAGAVAVGLSLVWGIFQLRRAWTVAERAQPGREREATPHER